MIDSCVNVGGCIVQCSETAQRDAARQKLELELGELKKEKVPLCVIQITVIIVIVLRQRMPGKLHSCSTACLRLFKVGMQSPSATP